MTNLYLDIESYSSVPIVYGAHAYAEKAEILLISYQVGDDPITVVDLTDPDKIGAKGAAWFGFLSWVKLADPIVMHNGANFDRIVLKHALGIDIPVERIHDTMVQALSHGLPGGLGVLCDIYKLPADQAKDKEGRKYINLFCKPTKEGKRNGRETHPKEWAGFIEYAKRDISSMRELYRKLPRWNYPDDVREHDLWRLDQQINDRGFAVDTELATKAICAVTQRQSALATETQTLTRNEVGSATQRDAMLKHILGTYGIELPDLTRSTLERRITDPDLPEPLRELLSVRLQATTSSTAKYKSLINGVSSDGRLRGTLQFCGASRTGRWSGRTFQPQNLPRPNLRPDVIEQGIRSFKASCADLLFDNVMEVASNCIRGCIVAPDARKLVVSDLSNIEGRVAAWLAGERWKLDAFRAYDTFKLDGNGNKIPDPKNKPGKKVEYLREGPDLYKLAYSRAFQIPHEEVTENQRQIGKVMELMLQYGGGVGAFLTGAAGYNIDLDAMAESAWDSVPENFRWDAAQWLYSDSNKQGNYGLKEQTFIVCDSLKRMWREAQPSIVQMWSRLEDTARHILRDNRVNMLGIGMGGPGTFYFSRDGAWLRIILPSGRSLCYASPNVDANGKITYMGIDQYSRKWVRISTYGGKLFENIVQAVARDVMAFGMVRAEAQGYQIVLTVHDELITETPNTSDFNANGLSAQMRCRSLWAEGLPLAATGYESKRYRKE